MGAKTFSVAGTAGKLDREALTHEFGSIFFANKISQGNNGGRMEARVKKRDQEGRWPGTIQDVRKAAAMKKKVSKTIQ